MAITTADTLVLLRGAYREARTLNKRLGDVLTSKSDALLAGLSSGQVIQSTTGQGLQAVFSRPGEGAPTPQEVARAYDSLLTLHDSERDTLIAAGDPNPTDATILAAIVRALDVTGSVFDTDFSYAAW